MRSDRELLYELLMILIEHGEFMDDEGRILVGDIAQEIYDEQL